MLRGNLSHDWPSLLEKVCEDYNNTPLKKLGWLKPNDIKTIFDSYKVRKAQKKFNVPIYNEPTFQDQIINQKNYENQGKKELQVNDYVYLDFNEELFGKSFDVQVNK